jgi:hypothetical protein
MSSRDNAKARSIPPRNASEESPGGLEGILDVALEIADKRRETIALLREALKAKNTVEVYRVAGEVCGLYDDEKSHRVN